MFKVQGSFFVLCLIASAMGKPTEEQSEQALRAVTGGTTQFSSKLFKTIGDSEKENLISSPLSAAIVLGMTSYGAKGETQRQFKEVLHLPAEDSMGKSGFLRFIDLLNNVNGVELEAANKIYVDNNLSVKPSFKELTETYFHSTSESINFANSDVAASTINSWVAQTTRNCIKTIVDSDSLQNAVMVLLNAIYFKGQWKYKFDTKNTKDLPFNVDQNTVKDVPTMYKLGSFYQGSLPNMNAKFIEIPYKGDELSMIIVLPNEVNGLPAVENKLKDADLVELVQQNGYSADVKLHLPKFKMSSMIDLNEPLMKMGLTNMFSDSANFSGITDAGVKVSKVIQKAFIEVNEEGTEAAAVTGIVAVLTSLHIPPPPINFKVDRPFLFAIVHKDVSTPLFVGRTVNPKV